MLDFEKIEVILAKLPAFRRGQVYDAIFKHLYDNWDQATNIPVETRAVLNDKSLLEVSAKVFESKDGQTVKVLITLADGLMIETVLMSLHGRHSVCVSTQVGCAMGCTFCDSGRLGFKRSLTVSEIVAQVLFFARRLKVTGEHITNVVYMGMGEPLLNYDNVVAATRLLSDDDGLGLSLRRFSISTSGILPGIKRLAEEPDFPVNLAVSLHAAIDEKRSQLMPVNKRFPLSKLSTAINDYFAMTKRKVMYEYILLSGVNTFEADAKALREFVTKAEAAYVVNLIPINATDCGYKTPSPAEVKRFKKFLDQFKVQYVQRYSFGQDIQAACGQLARRENE